MFRKILLSLALLVLLLPTGIQARNISELKGIYPVAYDEINEMCGQPPGYDPISGCYFPAKGIYIRDDLPKERFIFVFWHEVGHFFIEGVTDEQYRTLFNPTPLKLAGTALQEIAADTFALWMMGGKVPKNQKQFFIKLLTEK